MAGEFAEDLIDALPPWDAEQDETLICQRVQDETHDVKSFFFAPRRRSVMRFLPGQFLTFDLPIDGQILHRCYTIASSPARPFVLGITVKRVPNGPGSTWLHDHLMPGMALSVSAPMGDFTAANHPAGKYLFLSGGSGITPLMSMARAAHDLCATADIAFLHSARSPDDLIFADELTLMERANPSFRSMAICETDRPAQRWAGPLGRLSLPLLQLMVPDFREREIFTCGPAPYMAAVRAILGEAGFAMQHYHQESFDFAELTETPPPVTAASGTHFRVTFSKTNRVIECPADSFILDAARAAGLRLPSSCAKGLCGTCKSKMTGGQVAMTHAGGIRQREIDQGQVLLCCARPLSDLVIER